MHSINAEDIRTLILAWYLTHTISSVLTKVVYNMLTSIVKNAKKVIVGDVIILDNVFEFLKYRIKAEGKETLFITNKYA